MKVSDSIPKIYVLGPSSSGKTTFIQKHFSKELQDFENLIVESDSMTIPESYSKIFLILPDLEKLKTRKSLDEITPELQAEYWQWIDFYSKNDSVVQFKRVTEF